MYNVSVFDSGFDVVCYCDGGRGLALFGTLHILDERGVRKGSSGDAITKFMPILAAPIMSELAILLRPSPT